MNEDLIMNSNALHCFLLDGKTILPIDDHQQLFVSSRKRNSFNEQVHSINKNKNGLINEEDFYSSSFQSLKQRISEEKLRRFSRTTRRKTCKHHSSNRKLNQTETYLITRLLPSQNLVIDASSTKNNQSPLAMTIIIKPFISSENHRKDTSLAQKSSSKKRKKSLLSSSHQSANEQVLHQTRLSTFKDQTRSNPVTINFHENPSSNILHSRTLLNMYRQRKCY